MVEWNNLSSEKDVGRVKLKKVVFNCTGKEKFLSELIYILNKLFKLLTQIPNSDTGNLWIINKCNNQYIFIMN